MRKKNKTPKKMEVRMGSLIIAKPFWQEEDYKRSVILLLEHDHNGTVGLIINKPSILSTKDAIPDFNFKLPLFFGGPMQLKTISFIHNDSCIPDSIPLGNNLFWGGDFELLEKLIVSNEIDTDKIIFCAGYVFWNKGLLNEEILKDKWWVDDIGPDQLFSTSPDLLWTNKLLMGGHSYGLLNRIPDPLFN